MIFNKNTNQLVSDINTLDNLQAMLHHAEERKWTSESITEIDDAVSEIEKIKEEILDTQENIDLLSAVFLGEKN